MKTMFFILALACSFSSFAETADLTCYADDFSPVRLDAFKSESGYDVVLTVKNEVRAPLRAKGFIKADAVDLRIGERGRLVSDGAIGGIYGVINVTIPEYNLYGFPMACISEKF